MKRIAIGAVFAFAAQLCMAEDLVIMPGPSVYKCTQWSDAKNEALRTPLAMWVFGYTNEQQKEAGDRAYLNTPTLLDTEEIIVFSPGSDTALFNFRKFLNYLLLMYKCADPINTSHYGLQKRQQ